MSRAPSMSEVLREWFAAALEDIHTATPGRVVRYDEAKQQADVVPLVKQAYYDEDGERVALALPTIRNCPVQFPSGGGFIFTFPIAVGDTGLLVFSEASLDKWLSSKGDAPVDPDIDLRMGLSDAVFVPGVRAFGNPRSGPTGVVAIGRESGDFKRAAREGDKIMIPFLTLNAALTPGSTSSFDTDVEGTITEGSDDVKIT